VLDPSADSMLDLQRLGEGLRASFPKLNSVTPVRVLGYGFRSVAVETAEGLVFRVARNQAAAKRYTIERKLLPALQGRLPVQVPNPQFYAGPSKQFPFGVIGYQKLPGMSLSPEMLTDSNQQHITSDVAAFLLALHRFPVQEALQLGLLGSQTRRAELESIRDIVLSALQQLVKHNEHGIVATWWDDFLRDPTMETYSPVLQHGDLWYENILVEREPPRVVGVVDWENAAVGDPALDFSTQLHMGKQFADMVIRTYCDAGGVLDATFNHRMQKLWELREFGGLSFALQANDTAEIQDALRKLRKGPVLNTSAC
jgi:aminoglycoside 2''-phosphotransferase